MFCFRCKLIFEKKKKKKKKKKKTSPKSTWPPKPTSSYSSFLLASHKITSQEALMKLTWEPYFGYGLHIPKTYPHHIESNL